MSTQITDVTGFTALCNSAVNFGNHGSKVLANLAITDELTILSRMGAGWQSAGAAYYESENLIGAYGGYDFGETLEIERARFYIGRYSGQNLSLTVDIQILPPESGSSWVTVRQVYITTTLPYPTTFFDVAIGAQCRGVRWAHVTPPQKSMNNNIVFFGMLLYKNDAPPPPPPAGDVDLVLQYSASENNRVDKVLTEIATYSGTLRQSTSIIDPVFVVECSLPDVVGANYLTVEAFGRSYFIKNITSHRAGLVEFSCHVDVLSSFKTQLRTNRAIVHRSEKNWNLYLNDGSLKVKQTPRVTTQEFPGSFGNSYSFILVLAG